MGNAPLLRAHGSAFRGTMSWLLASLLLTTFGGNWHAQDCRFGRIRNRLSDVASGGMALAAPVVLSKQSFDCTRARDGHLSPSHEGRNVGTRWRSELQLDS